MGLLQVPGRRPRWDFKPDFPVRINWDDPITESLGQAVMLGYRSLDAVAYNLVHPSEIFAKTGSHTAALATGFNERGRYIESLHSGFNFSTIGSNGNGPTYSGSESSIYVGWEGTEGYASERAIAASTGAGDRMYLNTSGNVVLKIGGAVRATSTATISASSGVHGVGATTVNASEYQLLIDGTYESFSEGSSFGIFNEIETLGGLQGVGGALGKYRTMFSWNRRLSQIELERVYENEHCFLEGVPIWVPVGGSGLTPVSSSRSSGLEATAGVVEVAVQAWEALARAADGAVGSFESLAQAAQSGLSRVEVLARLAPAQSSPFESRASVSGVSASVFEAIATVVQSRGGLFEALQKLAPSVLVAWEAQSSAAVVASSAATALEALQGLNVSRAAPFAVLQGLVFDRESGIESKATIVVTGDAATETLAIVDNQLAANWEAIAQIERSLGVSFESLGGDLASSYEELEMLLRGECDLTLLLGDFHTIH